MTPRAARRPLPRTLNAWTRELRGIERMLKRVSGLKAAHGDKWVLKVVGYYKERREHLLANKPKPKKGGK